MTEVIDSAGNDGQSINSIADVNNALRRIGDGRREIKEAQSRTLSIIKAVREQEVHIVAPIEEEIAELHKQLARYLSRHKRSITAKHGITIVLEYGRVTYRVIARSLDTPKNVTPIINYLLGMRGGKRYLRIKFELDREKLAQADPKTIRRINAAIGGVWVGRHENISVQTSEDEKPSIILHRRFPRTRRQ